MKQVRQEEVGVAVRGRSDAAPKYCCVYTYDLSVVPYSIIKLVYIQYTIGMSDMAHTDFATGPAT